jgi:molecular chaperone GrpE
MKAKKDDETVAGKEGCCGQGCCSHENKQKQAGKQECCHDTEKSKGENQDSEHDCKCNHNHDDIDERECCQAETSKEETLQTQVLEQTDALMRLQAEFDNYRKRLAKESSLIVASANHALVRELLPVLDNFELALNNKGQDAEFKKGVDLIFHQLKNILSENGLSEISAVGAKFDPYYHEALIAQASTKETGIVLEELQKGYLFNNSVLRHARVKVSKKPSKEASSAECGEEDKK